MTAAEIIDEIKEFGSEENRKGMARFGINAEKALGIKIPVLRAYAKELKKQHQLALQLWETGIHEARLLAIFIADPKQTTEAQMEGWLRDFNSWDICDQACMNLFDRTPIAYQKALEWARREPEFEKRAGFALMASLALHDKKAPNQGLLPFLTEIEQQAHDPRNFVKKAVNWALRQIGKRNHELNAAAIETARRIALQNSKAARWIAADALRELQNEKQLARLK